MPRQTDAKQNSSVRSAKASAKIKSRALLISYAVILLGVIVGAALMCVFVFFKVNQINITGTAIYSQQDIIDALDINTGDNLVFADTEKARENLISKFPYVDDVSINKSIPATINVEVTEAEVYYSFKYGDKYVYVSKSLKILEKQDVPMDGSILVTCGEVTDEGGKIKLSDPQENEIFFEISNFFSEREKGGITEINLESIHNIYVMYGSRVKMILGSAADITYKLNYGLQIINTQGIKEDEQGSLDLSMSKTVNKAYFMPEINASPTPPAENTDSSASSNENGDSSTSADEGSQADEGSSEGNGESEDTVSSEGENSNDESSDENTSSETIERGQDIPDI